MSSRFEIAPDNFPELARLARCRLLRMHYEAGVGHIGGNLSALDVMLHLHHRVISEDDSFVLSKGHSVGALYVTLWSMGELSEENLREFHRDGTHLAGHPVQGWSARIPVATGSLGHGLPMAAGMALARRFHERPGRVYCLTSDGEWQEGSNWEALLFIHHHRLTNLTVVVDHNRLQGFGTTRRVASLEPLRPRFESFGLTVREGDGHDPETLNRLLPRGDNDAAVVVLHTVKGKGVSFMEDRMEWHYLPLDDELYARAVSEVGEA